MKRVFLFLATAAVAVSCSEVEIDSAIDAPVKGETLSITVNASEDISSRVAITESDNVWSASWEQGDALAGWISGENAVSKFDMSGTCSDDEATFVGTVNSGDLRLVYPYQNYTVTGNTITIDLSAQTVKDLAGEDLENVGDNAPLISNALISTEEAATATPAMQHIGAALQVRMQFSNVNDDYTIKTVTIKDVPATAEIDLTKGVDDADFCASVDDDITLTPATETTVANGTIYEASCNIIPFTIEANGSVTITVELADDSGATTSKDFSITNSSDAIEFGRGKIHWINISCDFDMQSTPADQQTLLDIQSTLEGSGTSLNWTTASSTAEWTGVTFDAEGYVTAINLPSAGLAGTIPSDLSTLSSLETLDLSDNSLTGNVPASFEDLVNMTTFKISGNSLSGTFPADVVNNPNYVAWNPMSNVYPQSGQTKADDNATATEMNSYKLKLNNTGILRAIYWHCGGPNWTYNNVDVTDLVTLNESTGEYEPEWLRGMSDGLESNDSSGKYIGILTTTSNSQTLQTIGAVNGTANSMRNMSGTLPLELAMTGTAFAQLRANDSGITGFDLRIMSNIKYLLCGSCTLNLDINTLLSSCLDEMAGATISNCSLTGVVSDATFSRLNSGVKPVITNNPDLTGSITDDQFITMGVFVESADAATKNTAKASFVSGTGITYTTSEDTDE